MKTLFKPHTFSLVPGAPSVKFPGVGDFVHVETAAAPFEISFDNVNFIPMREGRQIKTAEAFDAFWVRSPAGGTSVDVLVIVGEGSITNFATYGGGGGGGGGGPTLTVPYESYAALGNAPTVELRTGTLATVVINGLAETWQLRTWTGGAPVTDTDEGWIVPADYSAANSRVWFRS